MMMGYYVLIIFALFVAAAGDGNAAEDTLVLVHAIIRHGNRTPDPYTSFPSDMYRTYDFHPFGVGELNKKGIIKSYQAGKQLKERYENFLGPKYYPEIVEALSSPYTRCRMTMQLLLAAMFPPDSSQTFKKGLQWQPIGYKYNDLITDPFICTFLRCMPLLSNTSPRNSKQNLTQCKDREFVYQYLTNQCGTKVDSLKKIAMIHDTLRSEFENGLKLPKWAEPIWPEPLRTCAHDFWRYFLENKTVLAKAGGTFMKKLVDDSRDKIKGNSILERKKLFLYTAHDYNIYMFLKMLGNYNDIILNYLACMLFEVHKINGIYGFKIFLENHDGLGLKLLEIPGCGSFCPIDDYYERMQIYFNVEPC